MYHGGGGVQAVLSHGTAVHHDCLQAQQVAVDENFSTRSSFAAEL
jgi:hypothetical protein